MKVLAGCVAPEASQPDSKVDSFPLGLHPSEVSSSYYIIHIEALTHGKTSGKVFNFFVPEFLMF